MDGISHLDDYTALITAISERAETHDIRGEFPHDNIALLHEHGILGLTAPKALGGQSWGLAQSSDLIRRLGGACPSTALIVSMQLIHNHLLSHNQACSPTLRDEIGRGAVTDGALINVLRVEPTMGSPSRGGLPETIARRTTDGWCINGRKIYATGSPGLRWMLVYLRTDREAPETGYLLVPANTPGIEIVETWDHLGLRASCSHDVVFHDVRIAKDAVFDLRDAAAWQKPSPIQAAWNGLMIGALYTGIAEAARDWVIGFLRNRIPSGLGAPLSSLQRVQESVGQIQMHILNSRQLIASAAANLDRGVAVAAHDYAAIQTIAVEGAIAAVQRAVELAGNHGLSRANPLERHLRDVLCGRVHAPQPDATRTVLGKAALQYQEIPS